MVKPAAESTAYIPGLDGLRAIGFLFVFLAHTAPGAIAHHVPQELGVTLFFFLSGYLITTLLRMELEATGGISLRDFYIRRALRILAPMYVVFVVVAVGDSLVSLPLGNWRGLWSAVLFCYNYLHLLPNPAMVPAGLNVIWSLCVEEHFYVLFPVLYLLMARAGWSRRRQAGALVGLCVAGLCWRTYVHFHHFPAQWTYRTTDCRFDSLLWGCVLALWKNPRLDVASGRLRRYGGVLAAVSVAVLASDWVIRSATYREGLRYTVQGVLLCFIFHFVVSRAGHWSVRWLEGLPMRYIGWLSYSLYLIHLPVQMMVSTALRKAGWRISGHVGLVVLPVITLIVSLIYAAIVRQWLELPLKQVRARFRHAGSMRRAGVAIDGI